MKKVRVRFAPSPTGPLHIGGVRTALYNYLFAKKHHGDFILRIEDTDQARFVEGAEDYILKSLEWCGLSPDESPAKEGNYGPYRQSDRKDGYVQYARQLVDNGYAYYAFDTPEELDQIRKQYESEKRTFSYDSSTRLSLKNSLTISSEEVTRKLASEEPWVIRLLVPENEQITFKDEIRGTVIVNTGSIDDKVIFKADGMPTYHLANVIDDHSMEITHVIRGEEWLPSAPFHVLLYRYFGWEKEMPSFAHLPLILKPDGPGKLSKRDGDRLGFPVFPLQWLDPKTREVSSGYRENGYFPEAFVNMLAFLGWNPGTEQEIFSLEELIQSFSLERVGKSGAKFDPEKAKWFNEQYLRAKSPEELWPELQRIMADENIHISEEFGKKILSLMVERVTFLHEIIVQGSYLFSPPESYDEQTRKKRWKPASPEIISRLIDVFNATPSFNSVDLESTFKQYVEKNELGFGVAMISLRLVITGVGAGPSLFEIMELIGREESIKRMRNGIKVLTVETAAN